MIGAKNILNVGDVSEYSGLRWFYAVSAGNFTARHLSENFQLLQRNYSNFKPRKLRIIKVPNYPQLPNTLEIFLCRISSTDY